MAKNNNRLKMTFDVYPVLDDYSKVCEIRMNSHRGRSDEQYALLRVKQPSGFKDASMNQIWNRYKGTRDHISALDTAVTTEFLQDSQVHLTEIDKEMDKIRSETEKVFIKYMKLANKAAQCQNEMALVKLLNLPIRTFPPEILFMIFRLCIPVAGDGFLTAKYIALPLSQVCRSWREVAINDPFLWCSHGITIPDPDTLSEPSFPKRVALLEMFQARSGSRLKRLAVHDLTQSFNQPLEHSQIMDMLLFTFRHYAHIAFQDFSTTWYDYFHENWDRVDASTFENLTSLSLIIPTQLADTQDLVDFRDAARLSKAQVIVNDPKVIFTIQLPPGLRSLHYRAKKDHLSYTTLLPSGVSVWREHILGEYKHLEEVSLDFSPPDSDLQNLELRLFPLTPLVTEAIAPHIKTFSIRTSLPGDSSSIFAGIQLPALKNFTYEAADYALMTPTEPTPLNYYPHYNVGSMYMNVGVVLSTFRSLTNLVLIRVYAIDDDIRPIFQPMKSLESLQIFLAKDCNNTDSKGLTHPPHSTPEDLGFLQQLAEPPLDDDPGRDKYLLPRLRNLTVYFKCHLEDEAQWPRLELYSEIINSRSKGLAERAFSFSVGSKGFHFTLMFSHEHRMTAYLTWAMKLIRSACPQVCPTLIDYDIVDTFDWKCDEWVATQSSEYRAGSV